MHSESSQPRRRTSATVDGLRVVIEGTRVRLDGPTHWQFGDVERVAQSKSPQWTARTDDGRTHATRSRHLALVWLLEATADERAVKTAEIAARQAELDAERERLAAEDAEATRAASDLIRAVWPAYGGPGRLPFTNSTLFMFSPTEMLDLLARFAAPGPRMLPTADALKHLGQRSLVLCHIANASLEDPIPDPRPFVWGFMADAAAVEYGDDDSIAVNFAFEADRADELNEIEIPHLSRFAVVTRDAVTIVDQEGGFLLALAPEEGGETMEIAGLDGVDVDWDRDWAIEVANGPEPTFWREGIEDEADVDSDLPTTNPPEGSSPTSIVAA
jgi:hypothetical protein